MIVVAACCNLRPRGTKRNFLMQLMKMAVAFRVNSSNRTCCTSLILVLRFHHQGPRECDRKGDHIRESLAVHESVCGILIGNGIGFTAVPNNKQFICCDRAALCLRVLLMSASAILSIFYVFHYITCVRYVFPLHMTGGDKGGICNKLQPFCWCWDAGSSVDERSVLWSYQRAGRTLCFTHTSLCFTAGSGVLCSQYRLFLVLVLLLHSIPAHIHFHSHFVHTDLNISVPILYIITILLSVGSF